MKRFGVLFLSFAMAFSLAALPTSAADATAPDTVQATMVHSESMSEMVKEKAIQAFPEYEEKIRGENLTADMLAQPFSADYDPNEIVVSEMRQLSENEAIHYTERASGVALFAYIRYAGKNITNTGYINNNVIYDLNAWLNCSGSPDVLLINGVRTQVNASGTNSIINIGWINNNQLGTLPGTRGETVMSGTSANPAHVEYMTTFYIEQTTGQGSTIIPQMGNLVINADTTVIAQ